MGKSESNKDKPKDKKPFNIKRMVLRPTSWKRIGEYFTYGTFVGTGEKLKKTCLEFTEKAYKNDEFKELIMGEKEYRIWGFQNSFAVYTETGCAYYEPTDIWNLLQYGIYEIYKKTKDEKIIKYFVEALEIMISGEPYDVFTALQYMFCHSSKCESGQNAFVVDNSIYVKLQDRLKEIRWNGFIEEEINRITGIINSGKGVDTGNIG